jgi:predicted nuclease of predicted toxin-antitoxin system
LKLKIDENLPAECADLLRNAGFEPDTAVDENLGGADDTLIARRSEEEDRVLVTGCAT